MLKERKIDRVLVLKLRFILRVLSVGAADIAGIETEKIIPTLKIANDIANALGVCMYQVFDLDGKETYRCSACNSGRPL